MKLKIAEYLAFGIEYVWVFDSRSHTDEIHTRDRIEGIRDGKFTACPIEIDLNNLEP